MDKVLLAIDALTDAHCDALCRSVDGWGECVRIDENASESNYRAALEQARVAIGWPQPEWLIEAPTQMVQLASVGYDRYSIKPLLEKSDFVLCNAAGVLTVPVAEHCLAMMFALARQLPQHGRDKEVRVWKQAEKYTELHGSTVVVVGLGDIARQIAIWCAALGMRVTALTRHPHNHSLPGVQRIAGYDSLQSVLPECDHLVACVPSTPETRGMLDAEMIKLMKPSAFFYNVGRGDFTDEEALCDALAERRIAGAGLDVFREEPLPASSPLWELPNVMITPHVAGRSTVEFDRMTALFVDNLRRFGEGELPATAVINNLADV